ncbi:unnamed protein product [marine sediment metagenome]|uniref:Uncharacterized protein n=1 Tax=marine sediment metagenome TaxID=412755 RepID=X1B9U4_9ZZZZ
MGTVDKIAEKVLEKIQHLPDLLLKGGLFYAGARATGEASTVQQKLLGGTTALVGLRLAESPNLASGIAGVAVLGGIGVMNLPSINPYLPSDNVPTGGAGTPYQIDVYQGAPDTVRKYFGGRTG